MKSGVFTGTITALRFTDVPSFLRDLAWMDDMDIEIQVAKGWIREHVRFRVTGSDEELIKFKKKLSSSVESFSE